MRWSWLKRNLSIRCSNLSLTPQTFNTCLGLFEPRKTNSGKFWEKQSVGRKHFKCQKAFVALSVFFFWWEVGPSGSFLWQRLPCFKANPLFQKKKKKKSCLKEQSVRFVSARDKNHTKTLWTKLRWGTKKIFIIISRHLNL